MEDLWHEKKVFNAAVDNPALESIVVDYYKNFLLKVFPSKQLASSSCLTSMYYIEESTNVSTGFFSKDKVVENNRLEYARLRYDAGVDVYHVEKVSLKGKNLEAIVSSSTDFEYPENIERSSSMVEALTKLADVDKKMRLSAEKIIKDEKMLGECHYRHVARELGHILDLENEFHDCSQKGLTESGRFSLTSLVDGDKVSNKATSIEEHIEGLFKLCIESALYIELNKTRDMGSVDSTPQSIRWEYVSELYKTLADFSEKKKTADFSTKEKITEFLKFSELIRSHVSRFLNPEGGGSAMSSLCYERREYVQEEFRALQRLDLDIDWSKIKTPDVLLEEEKADIKRKYENAKAEIYNKKMDDLEKEKSNPKKHSASMKTPNVKKKYRPH